MKFEICKFEVQNFDFHKFFRRNNGIPYSVPFFPISAYWNSSVDGTKLGTQNIVPSTIGRNGKCLGRNGNFPYPPLDLSTYLSMDYDSKKYPEANNK